MRAPAPATSRAPAAMECGFVGILTIDLHLPEGSSLKGKRKEILRLKSGLVRRFACSVAEVDHHDLWQRSRLTIALVGRVASETEDRLAQASRHLHTDAVVQVVGESHEVIAVEGDRTGSWS